MLHPGFHGPGLERNSSPEVEAALGTLLEAFAAGTEGKAEPIVDLNFNLTTEGARRTAAALAAYDLAWLEIDCFDPEALAFVRAVDVDPDLLRREPLRHARVPAVLRSRRGRRRLRRRDLERLRPVEEDRRPRGDLRGQLRAAQLLQPPGDVHLGPVVRGDSQHAHPRGRRRRRAVEGRADDRVPDITGGVLAVPAGPGWGADVDEDVLRAHPWPSAG